MNGNRSFARLLIPLAIGGCASAVFWSTAYSRSSGRWDYYYLAEAFLQGRTWIPPAVVTSDTVLLDGRAYVPFAPLPAVILMPLVWLFGTPSLLPWEQTINVVVAGGVVMLCWVVLGRAERLPSRTRLWLVALFAFSTPVWWITAAGGPWHFAQLVATALSLVGIAESFGRRRPWLLGLVAAASFLTRPTLLFALPLYVAVAIWGADMRGSSVGWAGLRRSTAVVGPVVVAILVSFAYNAVRFGSPLESGNALAELHVQLEGTRDHGLFSIAYLPRNLDYFLLSRQLAGQRGSRSRAATGYPCSLRVRRSCWHSARTTNGA